MIFHKLHQTQLVAGSVTSQIRRPSTRIAFSHDGNRKGKLFLQMFNFAQQRFNSRLRIAIMTLDDISSYVVRPYRGDFFRIGHIG
ncbi:hypothetical protein A6U91_10625 [Agrobacterium tumefaciens]|uniref:Uncharacterized protein n=1 Tax=Agrobacterium tumefaciens TaxID=358 RepID=A0AB36EH85_AGRTU|nr:hypothetical protein A6U91_10625 [Agrobacterium tumefaciens]